MNTMIYIVARSAQTMFYEMKTRLFNEVVTVADLIIWDLAGFTVLSNSNFLPRESDRKLNCSFILINSEFIEFQR